jgi:hypothetical protein
MQMGQKRFSRIQAPLFQEALSSLTLFEREMRVRLERGWLF